MLLLLGGDQGCYLRLSTVGLSSSLSVHSAVCEAQWLLWPTQNLEQVLVMTPGKMRPGRLLHHTLPPYHTQPGESTKLGDLSRQLRPEAMGTHRGEGPEILEQCSFSPFATKSRSDLGGELQGPGLPWVLRLGLFSVPHTHDTIPDGADMVVRTHLKSAPLMSPLCTYQ